MPLVALTEPASAERSKINGPSGSEAVKPLLTPRL